MCTLRPERQSGFDVVTTMRQGTVNFIIMITQTFSGTYQLGQTLERQNAGVPVSLLLNPVCEIRQFLFIIIF